MSSFLSLPVVREVTGLLLIVLLLASTRDDTLRAQSVQVCINEVHYHPGDDSRSAEFVELHNFGEDDADIGGWLLHGGITHVFAPGTVIPAGGFLVVARNDVLIMDRHDLTVDSVVGNFEGSLENDSDALRLHTDGGYLISYLEYDDSDPWPQSPDGLGPSLERRSPLFEDGDPFTWDSSIHVGGSPGRANSVSVVEPPPTAGVSEIVPPGARWRFFRGVRQPPVGWNGHDFDDSDWEQGFSGFGYGDDDDTTVLDDMIDNYLTVYTRRRFVIDDRRLVESLALKIDYDDGFVAYINGTEIARVNVVNDGNGSPANGSGEAGSPETFAIADPLLVLRDGVNVLAVVGHNASIDSSDFSLAPALCGVLRPDDDPPFPEEDRSRAPRDLVINEVAPAGAGTGWVELFNPTDQAVDARGRRLRVLPGDDRDYDLPGGAIIAGGGFLVVDESELGFELDGIPALILSTAGGRYIDGLNPRTTDVSHSSGRFPDGDASRYVFTSPSPGTANEPDLENGVVINEIMYHPSDGSPGGEYIEIHNRSGSSVDLSGWSFTRGITFTFEAGVSITAGGFLVIARNPRSVIDGHGLPTSRVLGPWVGGLDNAAETVLLRDALSNPVDRVRFADDGSWPEAADGEGSSVELIHPGLENRFGAAWAASDEGGSPGEANTRLRANPDPIVVDINHSPVIPTSDDTVRVLATISDDDPISSATLFWEVDGEGGAAARVAMQDNGAADDGIANNGVWGAEIPARSNRDIIAFWIRATTPGGESVTAPAGAPTPACLYRVENTPPASPRPVYRVILRDDDYRELLLRPRRSNELLDSTFVADGRAYYNRGVRLRGSSARLCNPLSYRIQFDDDRDLHGIKRLNLNGCNTHRQWVGHDFLRRTGVATPTAWFRKLSLNGNTRDGLHLRVEAIDDQFLDHAFPSDDDGNLYRGEVRADLDYRGRSPDNYRDNYPKVTNEDEDDYTDLIDLCFRLDHRTTPDIWYPDLVELTVDVQQWSLYFAAFAFLGTTERSLLLDRGDDYFIYRRVSDNRWVLLPWDLDSCFDDESQQLFRPTVDSVERFLEHRLYAPDYWCHLEWILDNVFTPELNDARIDHLAPLVTADQLDDLRSFAQDRHRHILDRLRREVEVTRVSGGSICNGTLEATRSTIDLEGHAPGCGTTEVHVNDVPASFDQITSTWSATVNAGVDDETTIEISARDRDGFLVSSRRMPYANLSAPTALPTTISADTTLRRSQSPYRARNDVTVQAEATLEIEPGTVVLFDSVATLRVRGRVLALGTPNDPLVHRGAGWAEGWEGLAFLPGSTGNRLEHCRISKATLAESSSAAVMVDGADVTFAHTHIEAESDKALHVRAGGSLDLNGGSITSRRDGIVLAATGGTIDSCLFKGLPGSAILADGASDHDVRVEWSIFDSCGVAVTITDSAHAELGHLTIHGGGTGLSIHEDSPNAGSGTARAHSLIIWATRLPIFTVSATDLQISYCDTSSDPPPGDGNVSIDPAFVDADGGDFRLRPSSPCRGSGEDGTDMGAIPYATPEDTRSFVLCDTNADGTSDMSDAVYTLLYLFDGGSPASCTAAADCNSDTDVDVSDVVFALAHLFLGGGAPRAPYPASDQTHKNQCAVDTSPR